MVFNYDQYFFLFSSCRVTKGHQRAILSDFDREASVFIPNDLADILEQNTSCSLQEVFDRYPKINHPIITEYFTFLIEKEFIYLCDEDEVPFFSLPISLDFEEPCMISNAILDLNRNSNYDVEKVLFELFELGCKSIELRFFDLIALNQLKLILKFTKGKNFRTIRLITPFYNQLNFDDWKKIYDDFPLESIVIYSTPKALTAKLNLKSDENKVIIAYLSECIKDSSHCGVVDRAYFQTNQKFYSEATQFNSCLNKKVSVDVSGNIKNCPSMKKGFGNISDTTLSSVVKEFEFRTLWSITKDSVLICKDCEFRNICTDCRVYIEDPINQFSKPLKCGYNPYTAKWSNWKEDTAKLKIFENYEIL